MNKKEYNGWYNYETWSVNLWLTNSEVDYEWLMDLVGSGGTTYDKAEILKESVSDMNPCEESGLFSDLINAALSEVNWFEIIENHEAD